MVCKKLFLLGVMATGLSVGLMGTEISEIQKEVNELIDAYAGKLPVGMSKEEIKQDIPNYFTQEGLRALKHCIDVPDECRFPGVHNYEILKADLIEGVALSDQRNKEKSRVFLSGEESSVELMELEKRGALLQKHIKSNCDKVTLQFLEEFFTVNTSEEEVSFSKKYMGTFFTKDAWDTFAQKDSSDELTEENNAFLEKIALYMGMLRNLFLSKNR